MVLNIVTLSIIQNAYALITTTRKKGENKNVGLISYAFVWRTESVIVLLVKNCRAFCLVSILPLNTRITTVRFRQFQRFLLVEDRRKDRERNEAIREKRSWFRCKLTKGHFRE